MASFPFTAFAGQDSVKTALLLAIFDPGIDGVAISGSHCGVEWRSANLEHARTTVVDIELGDFRLGRSRYLAQALEAAYLQVEALEAPPRRG